MPTPGRSLKSVCWKSKDSVECLAVLSDRICSFRAIIEVQNRIVVIQDEKNRRKMMANKVYCERR